MSEIDAETHSKMRRTINQEFQRAEADFDKTHTIREGLVEKLRDAAMSVKILNDDNKVNDDTETGLRVVQTALRALEEVEKSSTKIITLKQKQQEANAMSAAASRERLDAVIRATAPGRIDQDDEDLNLEAHLEDMFGGEIKAFELKTSSTDLSG